MLYLINKSPSTPIHFKTPEHVWTGRPPSIAHLKPFGYLCYVHKKEGKLNPRPKRTIFLGYPKGVKGFKMWLIDENKCVISRDVIFNELVFPKANLQVVKNNKETDIFQFKVKNSNLDIPNNIGARLGTSPGYTNLEND